MKSKMKNIEDNEELEDRMKIMIPRRNNECINSDDRKYKMK